jgi:hypothetical protein
MERVMRKHEEVEVLRKWVGAERCQEEVGVNPEVRKWVDAERDTGSFQDSMRRRKLRRT